MTFLLGPKAQEPFFMCNDNTLSPQEYYSFMKPVFGPGVVYDASKKNMHESRHQYFLFWFHACGESEIPSRCTRVGVNTFLSGFMPTENLRYTKDAQE